MSFDENTVRYKYRTIDNIYIGNKNVNTELVYNYWLIEDIDIFKVFYNDYGNTEDIPRYEI